MPDHPMPFPEEGSRLPVHQPNRGPYASPPALSQEGAVDRKAERTHVLAVRQTARDVELARLQVAAHHAIDVAEMDAASMRLTERKLRIDQQIRLSRALGGEDPELQAKCALLDDDFFQAHRADEVRRQGRS